MAEALSISSVSSAGLTPISPRTLRPTPAETKAFVASTADTGSTIVSLSPQGRLLASQVQQNPQTAVATTARDIAASNSRTQSTRTTLQDILADPQRVVLRNILDPYFAALVASARLNELNAPSPVIDPKLLTTDSPAAVSPVPAYRAIKYYREGADLA